MIPSLRGLLHPVKPLLETTDKGEDPEISGETNINHRASAIQCAVVLIPAYLRDSEGFIECSPTTPGQFILIRISRISGISMRGGSRVDVSYPMLVRYPL